MEKRFMDINDWIEAIETLDRSQKALDNANNFERVKCVSMPENWKGDYLEDEEELEEE